MDMEALLEFIEAEDGRLRNRYAGLDEGKLVLARAVKLSEEVGELCSEVLAHGSLQRKQKLEGHDNAGLREEVADVIITAMLLARAMGVDVGKALEAKAEKLSRRD
jgi:NTP pyrophosphatase (non-canonical NTP hydrolase)